MSTSRNALRNRHEFRVKRGVDYDCWVCGNDGSWWRKDRRRDAQYCSDRCRQKAYRMRGRIRREVIRIRTKRDPLFRPKPANDPVWNKLARQTWDKVREQST